MLNPYHRYLKELELNPLVGKLPVDEPPNPRSVETTLGWLAHEIGRLTQRASLLGAATPQGEEVTLGAYRSLYEELFWRAQRLNCRTRFELFLQAEDRS